MAPLVILAIIFAVVTVGIITTIVIVEVLQTNSFSNLDSRLKTVENTSIPAPEVYSYYDLDSYVPVITSDLDDVVLGTIDKNLATYSVDDKGVMTFKYYFHQTSAGTAGAGGIYGFSLPDGYEFNMEGVEPFLGSVGSGFCAIGAVTYHMWVVIRDAANFSLVFDNSGNLNNVAVGTPIDFSVANLILSFDANVHVIKV